MPKISSKSQGSLPSSTESPPSTPCTKGAFENLSPPPTDSHCSKHLQTGNDDPHGPSISASSETRSKEAAASEIKQEEQGDSSPKSLDDTDNNIDKADPQKQEKEMNAVGGQMQAMQIAIQAIQESNEKISQDAQAMQTTVQAMQTKHTQDIENTKRSISTMTRVCFSSRIAEVEKNLIKGILDIAKYPGQDGRLQSLPAARVAYLLDRTPNEIEEERGPGYAEISHKFLLQRRELGQEFYFPEEELFGETSSEARTFSGQGPIPGENEQRSPQRN